RLPRGATSVSDLSVHIEEAVERGWLYASLKYGQPRVRVGHAVVGIVKTPNLRNVLASVSREFLKINPDDLTDKFATILAGSPEEKSAGASSPPEGAEAIAPAAMGKQEALAKFSVDL